MNKHILITGGAGFVGSNLACFLNESLDGYTISCLDNLIRPGSAINAKRIKDEGIKFIKGDIRREKDLLKLPKVDCLIDCSAEPSVLAAFDDPGYTIDTNLIGTINCLKLVKRDRAGFIFLSTSRVYPIEGLNHIPFEEKSSRFDYQKKTEGEGFSYKGITERFPLSGARSLYGATKLSSEHLIMEFIDMFDIKAVINRLGVIAGPWQMGKVDQGIVGYWMAKHIFGGTLKYFGYQGSGKQLRDAIHIDDVCELILQEITSLNKFNGKVFNVGGGRSNAFSLLELTQRVAQLTQNKIPVKSVLKERRADVRIYMSDNSFVSKETGWQPQKTLEDILQDTHQWMADHKDQLKKVLG